MTRRSLRKRLFQGAVLWTSGLLAAGIGLFAALLRPHLLERHGETLDLWHRVWVHPGGIAALAVLALVLSAAGLRTVRRALASFDLLRGRLAAVRGGSAGRLAGSYPSEVQPLVDDLNALLAHQERSLDRARTQAGELAHALKTPLAVLESEVDVLVAGGSAASAATIAEETRRMTRQVRFHLAQARAAAAGQAPGLSSQVASALDRLIPTLERLYRDRALEIDRRVDGGLAFRGAEEDLEEMLGNLLDNAYKWAGCRIELGGRREGDELMLTVDDDGPGIAEEDRERVLERGARGDAAKPGSGLGLAIVRQVAELYGGTVRLDASPAGGLRAVLRLPAS